MKSFRFRYLTQFSPETIENSHGINFEKSATYFDSNVAIKRIKSLLPHVRLIMIFTEPGTRAYSRYQHEIARTNQTITFDRLLNLNTEQTNEEYRHLRERCLQPGLYAEHLSKWLKYFSSKQVRLSSFLFLINKYVIEFLFDDRFISLMEKHSVKILDLCSMICKSHFFN